MNTSTDSTAHQKVSMAKLMPFLTELQEVKPILPVFKPTLYETIQEAREAKQRARQNYRHYATSYLAGKTTALKWRQAYDRYQAERLNYRMLALRMQKIKEAQL